MKFRHLNSNAIFCLICMLLLCACSTYNPEKPGKDKTLIYFHLETNADGSPRNAPVPIYRNRPMMVNVKMDPFLLNDSIDAARVVDVEGGFAIQIKFNQSGARALELITVANKGKRIAIGAAFPELRWLAAPLITQRITDGVFIFTPDANREESERIVDGINMVAKRIRQNDWLK